MGGDDGVALLVFEGGHRGEGSEDRLMSGVRRAVVLDLLEKALGARCMEPVLLVTDDLDLATAARRLGAGADLETDRPFHFGRRLQRLAGNLGTGGLVCMGGAACPLIHPVDLRAWTNILREQRQVFFVNNPMSPDVIGLRPLSVLAEIAPPESDNQLGQALRMAGLVRILLPHSARIHFDLDTPTDALILSLLPEPGPRTAPILENLPWDRSRLWAARQVLATPGAEIFLAGRVGPSVVTFLNSRLPLRVRVLSEERGMKALGRESTGRVRSLLAHWLGAGEGARGFFDYLATVCAAAFIDTRVLFAHAGRRVSAADRYRSDLGHWREIEDPLVRTFTRAAVEAELPVILGGHSLVSGGLWALAAAVAGGD